MPNGVCPFAEWISGVTAYQRGGGIRKGFCDHTAGGYMATMRNPNFWNNSGVSAHFAIGMDGSIIQLVNIFDTAWCQGQVNRPTWPYYDGTNPNNYLVSTEHEDKTQTNLVWPDAMYNADLRIKRWCIDEIEREQNADALVYGIESLTGHYMFDSVNRVYCPGSWWRNIGRQRLYNDLQDEDDNMINHSVVATWFTNRHYENDSIMHTMQARSDFQLPPSAKRVRMGVYLVNHNGGYVRFFNHDGSEASPVGWGMKPIYATTDVTLSDEGTCRFKAESGFFETAMIRSLGYWE